MFMVSLSRDLQNGGELNSLSPNGRELIYLPAWSNLNSQLSTVSFSKSSNSQDHLFGHDVIHTLAHILSGVYYDNGDCLSFAR